MVTGSLVVHVGYYFPDRLRMLMNKNKLTAPKIRKSCGIPERTLYRWLHGECNPNAEAYNLLCSTYHWDPKVLAKMPNEPLLFTYEDTGEVAKGGRSVDLITGTGC